ncbi:MAG TPA: F0F1 ATP synthase subunit A [Bacillales bacterium]|nr:F0F1 ATP synthase subunit A [Bacillales bacterium]
MNTDAVLHIAGIKFDLSIIAMIVVTCIITFVLIRMGSKNASISKISPMQNFVEWIVEFVQDFIGTTMDEEKGRKFLVLGLTLIIYIFIGNMLEIPFMIVTKVTEPISLFGQTLVSSSQLQEASNHVVNVLWWKSPTADPAAAMALALVVIVLAHYLGIRYNTKQYFKNYFSPYFFFFPFNIIEKLSNFLTLGMRLFGNIFAGEILITVILMMGWMGTIPLILWLGFSTFVGLIQAFIFAVLTMVYISSETSEEGH